MVKTILITNQKGGVGKTLIADEIAFACERSKVPYNFYDLDKQGGTLHADQPIIKNPKINIVDTPGSLQKDLVDWMRESNIIVIPTRLTSTDIPPLKVMINIISENDIKIPVIYVLNNWNKYRAAQDFVEWFKENYPSKKYAILPQSELFVQARAERKSILQYKQNSTPAELMKSLLRMIMRTIRS